jgi:hypothetical protein
MHALAFGYLEPYIAVDDEIVYTARPGITYAGHVLEVDARDGSAFIEYRLPSGIVTTGWRPLHMLVLA